ncbi:MAG: ribosome biogenesis GTP-binding protein YsxC [Parcubacteria group bacterium 21-54-25]|nr:MAG: ribosome biogenesis GTP-binding protein YsxC [Parcubacteria group bacterium 21-54-25]HQU08179.1 ribosome biogenesis GTP-binding protein YihA/YsxC [Candidatus Paceibacterota bacterium]
MALIREVTSAEFVKGIIGTDGILVDGVPEIAFVGRSNVGKSSVINSLVGQRALVKVGKKPGKTTEINFFSINNAACHFVDLPGYGYAKTGPKEKERIEKLILWYLMYSEARPHKAVLILDVKAGFTAFDAEMLRVLRERGHPYLIVANKVDKLSQKDLATQLAKIKEAAFEADVVPYSAATARGAEELLAQIVGE